MNPKKVTFADAKVQAGFCEDTALALAERTFSTEVDEQLAEDIIQYARRLHSRYTAPEVEQKPTLVVWVLYDTTTDEKYIKMNPSDGSLAIFDTEEDAIRAKRLHYGTDYKRCEYYSAPQPAPVVEELYKTSPLLDETNNNHLHAIALQRKERMLTEHKKRHKKTQEKQELIEHIKLLQNRVDALEKSVKGGEV